MSELERRTECVIHIDRKQRSSKVTASPSDKLMEKITRGSDYRPRPSSKRGTHLLEGLAFQKEFDLPHVSRIIGKEQGRMQDQ